MKQHPQDRGRGRRIALLLLAVVLFGLGTVSILRSGRIAEARVDRDAAWLQTLDRGRLALEVNGPESEEVRSAIELLSATATALAAEATLAPSGTHLLTTLDGLTTAIETRVRTTEGRTAVLRAIGDVETGLWADHATALEAATRARVQLQLLALLAVVLAGLAAMAASTAHRRRLAAEQLGRDLESALGQAEEARRTADAANRAKSEFLATISHEIRTPMMAIVGMSELLGTTEVDDRQRRYLETIDASSAALMSLIGDVLDLSRIEAGTLQLEPGDFDLAHLVSGVGLLFEDAARRKGLMFRTVLEAGLPETVHGDEVRVRQVLVNFVGNAVKFTAMGGVELRVRRGGPGTIRFEVEDSGVGLPPEFEDKVFEPFSQVDASSTREHGGAGLGLAISRQIVEAMSGTIGVVNRPGEGCCFFAEVLLPTVAVKAEEEGTLASQPAPGARVLVVDDNRDARTIISSMLESAACEVEAVGSGEEGLERALATRFDLILMDCDMPGMDGLETTEALRASGGVHATTVVVGLSGHVLDDARERARAAGMNDYLAKPLRRAELLQAVARWTGGS